MTKIWEIDFTSFSGTSDILYDQVGTQHLTVTSGTINKQDPLITFANRRGIYFSANANIQQYALFKPTLIDLTNARITASYTQRSFVLWLYTYGMGNATYWETTSNKINIWGSYDVGARVDTGIAGTSNGNGIDIMTSTTTAIISYGYPLSDGWHCIVLTIDRSAPQTKLYIDKGLINSSTSVISSYSPTLGEVIGDSGGSNEGTFYVGQATTYNHILTQTEVDTIYDTFLVDTQVGPAYFQTFSGYVYGLDGNTISGVSLKAYHSTLQDIVHTTTSSGDGFYNMVLPYSGSYMVIVDNVPSGCQTIQAVATATGVYFP